MVNLRLIALTALFLTGSLAANQNRPTGIPENAHFNPTHQVWVLETPSQQTVWFAGGTKKAEGGLKQGQREGSWIFYFENGKKRAEGSYAANRMIGSWKQYFKSGALQSEGDYLNNSKTGPWTSYFENGKKRSEGNYSGGLKHGPWIEYYESGSVFFKGQYLADLAQGTWTYYFENGSFYQAGNYREDVRVGIWKICIAPGGPCGEENLRQHEPPRVSGLPKEGTVPLDGDPMRILDSPEDDREEGSREELPPSMRSDWDRR